MKNRKLKLKSYLLNNPASEQLFYEVSKRIKYKFDSPFTFEDCQNFLNKYSFDLDWMILSYPGDYIDDVSFSVSTHDPALLKDDFESGDSFFLLCAVESDPLDENAEQKTKDIIDSVLLSDSPFNWLYYLV